MDTAERDPDLTARATIRNAALRLFAAHGPDRVTIREIARTAGVSAPLVVHHFGSKAGLRAAVDTWAAEAFDELVDAIESDDVAAALRGEGTTSIAEACARAFPADSALPAYLRRLLLSGDPAGSELFTRWFRLTEQMLESLRAAGVTAPSDDPPVRAAFLLANDLALILLRDQIADAIGVDPLSPSGIARWADEATTVYAHGAFVEPGQEHP